MNNEIPTFWRWEKELSENVIQTIESEMTNFEFSDAAVGLEENKVDYKIRKSSVHMTKSIYWMAGILHNYGLHANVSSGWGFSLSMPETCQITKYGLDEFYDFHTDNEPVSFAPYVRKVSVACCITDADTYEGGEFEFQGIEPIKMNRGDIIVFPSGTLHRVKPVTSGERRSLITWILGPNTK